MRIFIITSLALTFFSTVQAKMLPDQLAAHQLVRRVIGTKAKQVSFYKIDTENGLDTFEIKNSSKGIKIGGNNCLSMTSGFHWYLKHVAKCHISWNGNQLQLPAKLKSVPKTIKKSSITKHGFCFNYCTFNYTMAWWDWERWEKEIDYMALCGINMPLAIVGSEALWLNFLKRFGYSTSEAKNFISGPAYTAWWLMGNLEGVGGPVTDAWIEQQKLLQQKILKRMRELKMRPALPGFVGLIPTNLQKKFPKAKVLPQGKWAGGNIRPYVLSPEDPLFDKMAKAWYEELEKLYGKADTFAGDLFHEGGNSHGMDVGKIATKIQKYMLNHNPNSIWTIQGWGGNPRQGLLKGLKKENTLVVELCNEFWRNWQRSNGFYGYDWAFSTIIMYGGNTSFHGRLDTISDNLNAALTSTTKPVALGTTWESIEVNPIVMDYLWDMKWRTASPDLKQWVSEYSERRYGIKSSFVKNAWEKLLKSVYASYPGQRRPQESLFAARPSLNVRKASPYAATCKISYDQRDVRDALKLLLKVAPQCHKKRTYRFDVVDLGRQFIANAGQIVYHEMVAAFKAKDKAEFDKRSKEFLGMFDDQDELLATEPLYTVGKWLHDSQKVAPNAEQAKQNELNARTLITTWTFNQTGLNNYAWREWAGLTKNYYKPRWQAFIKNPSRRLNNQPQVPFNEFQMAKTWCNKTLKEDPYSNQPVGNPIKVAKKIISKYGKILDSRYTPPITKITAEQVIGLWEYKAQGATWQRKLDPDGALHLFRNGVKQKNWKNFSWQLKNGQVELMKKNGTTFGTLTLTAPGKAIFTGGYKATRLETGKNREAEEAVDL